MRQFILGTDWWTDCDDAVAIRLLARAHRSGQIRLLGIGINACMEDSARSLDGFLCLEGIGAIPLGIDRTATDFGGHPPYQKRLTRYAKKVHGNEDLPDAVRLYRSLLASSGGGVELIEIGYTQVLAALLESEPDEFSPLDGISLLRKKTTKVWMMAGKWDEEKGRENNFTRAPRTRRGADAVLRLCPVPITFLGWEIGATVITGGKLSGNDPLHTVLADHGSPQGRSSWDPMLVLLALTGSEEEAGYRTVRGRAHVDPETGENSFVRDEKGPHAFVVKTREDRYYADQIDRLIGNWQCMTDMQS